MNPGKKIRKQVPRNTRVFFNLLNFFSFSLIIKLLLSSVIVISFKPLQILLQKLSFSVIIDDHGTSIVKTLDQDF